MKDKLNIQLDAINRYIDKLLICEEQKNPLTNAYKDIVNELRTEAGMEPLKKPKGLKWKLK